eukprot:3308847-Rhodomonas_salina.1
MRPDKIWSPGTREAVGGIVRRRTNAVKTGGIWLLFKNEKVSVPGVSPQRSSVLFHVLHRTQPPELSHFRNKLATRDNFEIHDRYPGRNFFPTTQEGIHTSGRNSHVSVDTSQQSKSIHCRDSLSLFEKGPGVAGRQKLRRPKLIARIGVVFN